MMLCGVCASFLSLAIQNDFPCFDGHQSRKLIKILTMLSIILNITVFSILFILNKTLN